MMFIGYFSFGQIKISGIVSDSNKTPLVGCHVHAGKNFVVTDGNGAFEFKNLAKNKIRLYATYVGFKTFDTIVDVQKDILMTIILVKSINSLNEIEIKLKTNSENNSILEQKIRTETIDRYSNQTLGDALKEVAGVSVLKTGSNIVKPIINGLSSSRVPIISNNVRLEDQQWGTEHAPNFDINAAGKISVIKGASALQYGGDAIGGLVIIEPISVKKDTLFGKTIMNYNTNGRGGTISSSLHKGNFCDWSWNALGTFKYSGDRHTPNYNLSNTANRELNFAGDAKYTGKNYHIAAFYSLYNAQIGILRASHIGNVNDLYQAINNQIPFVVADFTYNINNPRQKIQHHLAKIDFGYRFSDNENLSAQYAFQFNNRKEFDIRRGNRNNIPALDLDLSTHSLIIDYNKIQNSWTFKSGFSVQYQNNFANPETGVRPLIPTYERYDTGIYSIATRKINETISVDGGIRYDFSNIQASKFYIKTRWTSLGYDPEFTNFIVNEQNGQLFTRPTFTYHNFAASLGLHKVFENDIDAYANASLSMRNPNVSELFSDGLHHATGVIEIGDLRLQQEKSLKAAVTLQRRWNSLSVTINPFLNRINNFMFLQPTGFETTIRGAFPVWEYKQTNVLLTGIDFQSVWKIKSDLNLTMVLGIVNGQNLSENLPLIDMPPINFSNKIDFIKSRWYNFSASLKHEVVLQQNRFPDYDFDTNIFVNNSLQSVRVNISKPPPTYQLWSCSAQMSFKTLKNSVTTVMLSGQNLLNTAYRDYLNRQRFFADEMGRNIQLQLKINY